MGCIMSFNLNCFEIVDYDVKIRKYIKEISYPSFILVYHHIDDDPTLSYDMVYEEPISLVLDRDNLSIDISKKIATLAVNYVLTHNSNIGSIEELSKEVNKLIDQIFDSNTEFPDYLFKEFD